MSPLAGDETPATVAAEVKADPGARYMPEALPLLIEELLLEADAGAVTRITVALSTYGYVYQGIGEVHLTIAVIPPGATAVAEAPMELAA
jgi:hypothetical protein